MQVRLNKEQHIRLLNSADVHKVMQQILLRQQKIDRNREHFWVIGLANDHSILFLELVSMGTVNRTLIEPMEVYSFALQKRSMKIMMVHNHPSGKLEPSEADKDITDRMIQVGLIVNVPVLDHLIINEQTYYSFLDSGLLVTLQASKKYVPPYVLEAAARKEQEEAIALEQVRQMQQMAKIMLQAGEPEEKILQYTGLTAAALSGLREE